MSIDEKKRIVVKVGTSTLTHKTGKTNIARMAKLVSVLADLHNMGHEVILVSSGAISIGMGRLNLAEKPDEIPETQALAAIGQGELMFMYDKMFGEYDIVVAQMLFTTDVLEKEDDRRHFLNTFNQLLVYGAIPIVNENDSISIDELVNGDNDCLSAMFTDTDGLYDSNPSENKDAKLIELVEEITPEIESLAGGAGSRGTGGFTTKIKSAKIATDAGIPVVIANGNKPTKLYKILEGKQVGTRFLPKE